MAPPTVCRGARRVALAGRSVAAACARGAAPSSLRNETDGHGRLEAVRRRVECGSALGAARLRASERRRTSRSRSPGCPRRHKAIGVLFTNPGGPGGSGVDFLRDADDVFPAEIRDSFDLVSWDPRGVGASAPVRCLDDLDAFYAVDRDPTTPAAVAAERRAPRSVRRRVQAQQRQPAAVRVDGRDGPRPRRDPRRDRRGADQLRRLLVRHATSVRSYADMFPTHVRAMVLDGAVDPARSYADTAIDQAKSFDDDLDRVLRALPGRRALRVRARRRSRPRRTTISPRRSRRSRSRRPSTASTARSGPASSTSASPARSYSGADGLRRRSRRARASRPGHRRRACSRSPTRTPGARRAGSTRTRPRRSTRSVASTRPSPPTVAAVQQLAAPRRRVAPHFGAVDGRGSGCRARSGPSPAQGKVGADPRARARRRSSSSARPTIPPRRTRGRSRSRRELQSGRLLTADGASHTSYGRGDSVRRRHRRRLPARPHRARGRRRAAADARRAEPVRSTSSDSMRIALPRMIL